MQVNSLQKKNHKEKKNVHPNMYTKYLCLKARRVSLSSIHFSFVICSLMQMNWPQANRFITWQHIHKASSIQRKESWTTVIEDTKKCTDPKLMSLAINRLNFYPNLIIKENNPSIRTLGYGYLDIDTIQLSNVWIHG